MSLWVDKYRPKKFSQISYHPQITASLKSLASTGDFPHLLVYGPSGAGKKTRIYATLSELFGALVDKLKIDVKTFTNSSNRKLEFNVLSSPCHIEITPSDMGNNDRVVIQDLLKDIASTEQVDFSNPSKSGARHRFKVVIINEADSLSRDAQAALRRTMEKYSANIRLIMVCNNISSIIAPIKSRTLLVRVPAPSVSQIADILFHIAQKESVKFSSQDFDKQKKFLEAVAAGSSQNLRRSVLTFETISMQTETVNVDKLDSAAIVLDWEVLIKSVALSLRKDKSVANLAKLRVTFYELLSHCIPSTLILKTLVLELAMSEQKYCKDLLETAAIFDERLSLGLKAIFHLEGFAARAMVIMT